MKIGRRAIFTSLIIALAAALAAFYLLAQNGKRPAGGSVKNTVVKSYPVRVSIPEVRDVPYIIKSVGTLLPDEDITVGAEVEGRIERLYVDEGDAVKKGDAMLQIDATSFQLAAGQAEAAVKEAQAALQNLMDWTRPEKVRQIEARLSQANIELENARKDFERFKALVERQTIDQRTFDQVKTRYDVAKKAAQQVEEELRLATAGPTAAEIAAARAKVEQARSRLQIANKTVRDATVRAPADGVIVKRKVSAGEYVKVGDMLVRILDSDPLKVSFSVAERFLPEVRTGQKVYARVKALGERAFEGNVYFISPEVDSATRSFNVKARIPNPSGELKPGLFADVELVTMIKKHALVLPEEAIVMVSGSPSIYRVNNGKAYLLSVKIGKRFEGKAELISDELKPDDQVIVEGHKDLSDGAPVEIIKEKV